MSYIDRLWTGQSIAIILKIINIIYGLKWPSGLIECYCMSYVLLAVFGYQVTTAGMDCNEQAWLVQERESLTSTTGTKDDQKSEGSHLNNKMNSGCGPSSKANWFSFKRRLCFYKTQQLPV